MKLDGDGDRPRRGPGRRAPLAIAALASLAGAGAPPARAEAVRPPDQELRLQVSPDRSEPIGVYLDADRRRGFVTVGSGPARRTSRIYPLWKVAVADFAGDGRDRVLLGLWSRQGRHDEPEAGRTVWVLGWDGRALYEEWRGSALARPLRDFAAADLDGSGGDELLALETTTGRAGAPACVATAYRWNGFGFAGVASIPVPCDARLDERRPGCFAGALADRCAILRHRTLELR